MASRSSSGRRNKASKEQDTCKGTLSYRNGVELVTLDDDCPTELITNPGGVLRKKPSPTVEKSKPDDQEVRVSPGDNQESNAQQEDPLQDLLGMDKKQPTAQEKYRAYVGELRKKRSKMSELFEGECQPYLRTLFSIRGFSAHMKWSQRMSLDHIDLISELLHSRDQLDAESLMQSIRVITESWSHYKQAILDCGLEELKEGNVSFSTSSSDSAQ